MYHLSGEGTETGEGTAGEGEPAEEVGRNTIVGPVDAGSFLNAGRKVQRQ